MEKLQSDLMKILGIKENTEEEKQLSVLLNCSVMNVCVKRYPFKDAFTDDDKSAVINKYFSVIFNAVMYAYNKQGAEGENSHSENGINRSYIDEKSLYLDVIPVALVD